ncbi:MAG: hypothetical protein JWN94_3260 [Betaproteobacteria bacterium]|nr:hypothetical protein [Betaproteobacteria bacterium]
MIRQDKSILHQSILAFRQGRYLKIALILCATAIAVYCGQDLPAVYRKPYGGTWLGYTLGTLGALMILWLMLLGVRKRRYASGAGSVQGWTSAHVYLGTSLIVIATLHCGFEFGFNIHTLAYVLMITVIASGFFGVYAYLRYPQYMTANLAGETLKTMLLKAADLDRKCKRIALDLPDDVNAIVMASSKRAAKHTVRGGSFAYQLAGVDPDDPMRQARDQLLQIGREIPAGQAEKYKQLVEEMARLVSLTDRVRRDLQIRAVMQVWLYFHVPLSFALLAALSAHVLSVFFFW